jgi:hypothetical protein
MMRLSVGVGVGVDIGASAGAGAGVCVSSCAPKSRGFVETRFRFRG